MSRIRTRIGEIAKSKGVILSRLQQDAKLPVNTARRYWYSTNDGKRDGDPLVEFNSNILSAIADVLGVGVLDLLEDKTAPKAPKRFNFEVPKIMELAVRSVDDVEDDVIDVLYEHGSDEQMSLSDIIKVLQGFNSSNTGELIQQALAALCSESFIEHRPADNSYILTGKGVDDWMSRHLDD